MKEFAESRFLGLYYYSIYDTENYKKYEKINSDLMSIISKNIWMRYMDLFSFNFVCFSKRLR